MRSTALIVAIAGLLFACSRHGDPEPASHGVPNRRFDQIRRADFNRYAVRLDLPVYWIADHNGDGAIEPAEVAALLFYPTTGHWVAHDELTPGFVTAYDAIVAAAHGDTVPGADAHRLELVANDLDGAIPTLVRTDTSSWTVQDRAFLDRMRTVADRVDDLYAAQTGVSNLPRPSDALSRALMRRNRGPACVSPANGHDPACTALPGVPAPLLTVYPPMLGHVAQGAAGFCEALHHEPNARDLAGPFTAVRERDGALVAIPYAEAYRSAAAAVSAALRDAAAALEVPAEQALRDYVQAAATAFVTDDWYAADEAWARMSSDNSRWYLRVAPDETYFDPCATKAAYGLTLARTDATSKAWQRRLQPLRDDMEAAVAARAGAPYRARQVAFHVPDFVDVVLHAGYERAPLGATIGDSLPNTGPVAEQGRRRTTVMINLLKDPDSIATLRAVVASLFDRDALTTYAPESEAGLVDPMLHEIAHNLGPNRDYRVGGRSANDVFGGGVAEMLEELKAQTGALFLVELSRAHGVVSDQLASQIYADGIEWAIGHVARGMYAGDGSRKPYGQAGAIQLGILIEEGALIWDPHARAADASASGAFAIRRDKLVPAIDHMMTQIAGVLARGDKPAADALLARYVDGSAVVPHEIVAERLANLPDASLVYAIAP